MSMHGEAEHYHHASDHEHGHSHIHGVIDATIASTDRGVWALKWSFVGLFATALAQVGIVAISGSVALLADTIHNFADAATAIPLWIAFALIRLKSARRFSYGYGRVEDLAGIAIVLTILFSALIAGYESLRRFIRPEPMEYLWAVIGAAGLGFLGNEAVALLRIKVGREIGSAALVADGYHARADGLTSLAVLGGAIGVWLGYPLADPLAGMLITLVILGLVWQSARAILTRVLDGVEPGVLEGVGHAAQHVPGVRQVADVRARWSGHRLFVELNVAVDPALSVVEGHGIAKEVHHQIAHRVPHVSQVTVHVDPLTEVGEERHRVVAHAHDGLPVHSHP
jgi:cation diffusion facilitator family transporter